LTGFDVPGSAGVPVGLQSGPVVQAPLEPWVAVGAGDTGAPPDVVLELAGVVCVTDVVVVVAGLVVVPVGVGAAPVVADWVEDDELVRL
jgi:hypothetical protein